MPEKIRQFLQISKSCIQEHLKLSRYYTDMVDSAFGNETIRHRNGLARPNFDKHKYLYTRAEKRWFGNTGHPDNTIVIIQEVLQSPAYQLRVDRQLLCQVFDGFSRRRLQLIYQPEIQFIRSIKLGFRNSLGILFQILPGYLHRFHEQYGLSICQMRNVAQVSVKEVH